MTQREAFGERGGVTLHVVAWDGVAADVDLSCACMFTREAGNNCPQGGLAHLDSALDNRLTQWRSEGLFQAEHGDTIFLDRPPARITARSVMVIGLGDPDRWSPAATAGAVHLAFSAAGLHHATSVAFAPSMFDAGLDPDRIGDAAERMVGAVASAIDLDRRLIRDGFAQGSSVRDWIFDVGAARFESVLARFRAALDAVEPQAL